MTTNEGTPKTGTYSPEYEEEMRLQKFLLFLDRANNSGVRTVTRLLILSVLATEGGQRVMDLAARVAGNAGSLGPGKRRVAKGVGALVVDMEEMGWISRRPATGTEAPRNGKAAGGRPDRRVAILEITEKGREFLRHVVR